MSPLTPKIAAVRAAAAQTLTLNGRVSWPFFALAAILTVALALRLHGLNWDDGFGFHPDERDIYFRSDCMYRLLADQPGAKSCGYLAQQPEAEPGLTGLRHFLDPDRSPLNPHWFPLGSILIYMMVFIRSVIELFTDLGGLEMRYAGRALSALADAGSVLLVFVLGRRLYGRNVGLMAAALTALAVIHIQNSHFYRPETFTVLLTLASIWATLRMVQNRRLIDSALLGLILGLALAPKVNVLPLLAPLALGYVYRIQDDAGGRWRDITPEIVQKIAAHAALAAAVALAIFFITTPYAIIDIGAFIADVTAQTRMARNAGLWPFTTQYIDTPAVPLPNPPNRRMGPRPAAGHRRLAIPPRHRRAAIPGPPPPPRRSNAAGLGNPQPAIPGKFRSPFPALPVPANAGNDPNGRPNAAMDH